MTLEFSVDGRQRRAAVWVPPGFAARRAAAPDHRWPLILALHGYGERGDDDEHLAHGLGPVLERHPERFDAIVVQPQCPRDLVWVVVDRPWARGHGSAEPHLDAVLDTALAELPVDPDRVALTGLSMGGFGTFVWGGRRIERFCALLAICGGGIPSEAAALTRRPLWAIHGDADDVVEVASSREMIAAIRAAGGEPRYTEYPGCGHNSWDRAYADPEVARFLQQHRRPAGE